MVGIHVLLKKTPILHSQGPDRNTLPGAFKSKRNTKTYQCLYFSLLMIQLCTIIIIWHLSKKHFTSTTYQYFGKQIIMLLLASLIVYLETLKTV